MKILKIKKIRPLNTTVITTADLYEEDVKKGALVTKVEGTLKEYQRVVAVGSLVRNIEVGDLVAVNPTNYAVRKHKPGSLKDGIIEDNVVTGYNFKMVEIDGVNHLFLQDRDIDYVIEESEEVDEAPKSNIIMPDKPTIIT